MKKFVVDVVSTVFIEIDETKFTDEFMEEFSKYIFLVETLNEFIEHLAILTVHGDIDCNISNRFIEGIGPQKDMNIAGEILSEYIENVREIV